MKSDVDLYLGLHNVSYQTLNIAKGTAGAEAGLALPASLRPRLPFL